MEEPGTLVGVQLVAQDTSGARVDLAETAILISDPQGTAVLRIA